MSVLDFLLKLNPVSYLFYFLSQNFRESTVRENVRENYFFQGQGIL